MKEAFLDGAIIVVNPTIMPSYVSKLPFDSPQFPFNWNSKVMERSEVLEHEIMFVSSG